MSETRDSAILTAALHYAARGWPVFPCSPEDKKPLVPTRAEREAGWCVVAGERRDLTQKGSGGFKLATTDEATIRDWWKRWPAAMIGMPTGRASDGIGADVMVVDLDPRIAPANAMLGALQVLCNGAADKPFDVPLVRTQSGGLHLWFQYPDIPVRLKPNGEPESDNRVGLFASKDYDGIAGLKETIREHVDIRGDGGYVILPPSRMNNGRRYEWEFESAALPMEGEPLPRLPARILDAVLKRGEFAPKAHKAAASSALTVATDPASEAQRKYAANAMLAECNALAATPAGQRHDALNRASFALGTLVGAGALSEGVARAALTDAAQWAGSVFSKKEADTIEDGLRAGIESPRDLSDVGKRAGRVSSRQAPAKAGYAKARDSAAANPSPSSGVSNSYSEAPGPHFEDEAASAEPSQVSDDDSEGSALAAGSIGGGGGGSSRIRLGGDASGDNGGETIEYCAEQPENDTGNGKRLLAWHGANFLNVRMHGWHRWTGTHFEIEDGEEFVTRFAQMTSAAIDQEADYMGMSDWEAERIAEGALARKTLPVDRTEAQVESIALEATLKRAVAARKKARRRFAVQSGNSGKIKGMMEQALPWRTYHPRWMDKDRTAVNMLNGTLRVRREAEEGRRWVETVFSPHNRADRFTKVMPTTYQPLATCPKWDEFLETTQPDPEMRGFLQCYAGACLLGAKGKPVLLFHYGAGANGKSTFAEALRQLFGGYAQTLNAEAFSGIGQKRGDQATPELAQLPGKRLVIVSELAEGEPIKENLIKALTGGEGVQARHLNKGFFDFNPEFRAMMSGNDMPRITGTDFGIWRRLKIVPWLVTLPEPSQREMDAVMSDFEAERSGIFNWLLAGLERFLLEGLTIPPAVQELTESYKAEVDIVGGFISACLEGVPLDPADSAHGVRAGYLYEVFLLWAKENGVITLKMAKFGREMKKHGIAREDLRVRRYLGVKLRADAPRPSIHVADPYDN